MRVLHLLNELKPSGAETMLKHASGHWKRFGVVGEVLSTGESVGSYVGELEAAGYVVHHLPFRKSFSYFLAYARLIKSGGFSVVHQHAERASYWFALVSLLCGVRVVRTLHSNFPFSGWLRKVRGFQRRHLRRLGVRFVSIAPGVQGNERIKFGLESDLIWNWIDTCHFRAGSPDEVAAARKFWKVDGDALVLVTVGNCSDVKDHQLLLRAIAALSMDDREGVKYLHVGLEDDTCSERRLSDELGVSQVTNFVGWLKDPRDALVAADLFVMSSKREGLGLSAVEALGVGLPAMLTEVDGLRDLRELYPHLIYVEPSVDGLKKGLESFISLGRKGWKALSNENAKITADNFGVARGVEQYCSIYRNESVALGSEKGRGA